MDVRYGAFCDQCWDKEVARCNAWINQFLPPNGDILYIVKPDSDNVTYGIVEWLAKHTEEMHNE